MSKERNCPDDKDAVYVIGTRYDEFFRVTLWRAGGGARSWYEDVESKMCAALGKYEDCVKDLPKAPARPDEMNLDAITTPFELREAIVERAITVTMWSAKVTDVAKCVQNELSDECKRKHDGRWKDVKKASELLEVAIAPDVATARVVCRNSLKWILRFYQWAKALAIWENAITKGCVKTKFRMMQVTPPPWPPWGGYNPDDQDNPSMMVGHAHGVPTDLYTESLERLFETLLERARRLATKDEDNKLDAFPHGLNEISAELTIEGAFSVKLSLKGPDHA
ncbi:MAG: hypothetical protein ABIW79_04340 [Gemmatimonas sp.]